MISERHEEKNKYKDVFDSRSNSWLDLVILVENSLSIHDIVIETTLGKAKPGTKAKIHRLQVYEAYHRGEEFIIRNSAWKWVYDIAYPSNV